MKILPSDPPRRLGTIETRWSVVRRLDAAADPRWQEAWAHLSTTYRPAMEAYVRRLLGRATGREDAEEAADLVQGFLAACTEKSWLGRADPGRGPFRAFVQTLLRRFVFHRLDAARAQRRRPAAGKVVPLDDVAPDGLAGRADDDPAAARALEEGWVRAAVERALDRLRRGNDRYHAVIADLIANEGENGPEFALRLGLGAKDLTLLRHRARRRFVLLFEEELRTTVSNDDEFADEWRALAVHLP
jgi:RNA polymerase sigma-70 factor (ECF subfamily)